MKPHKISINLTQNLKLGTGIKQMKLANSITKTLQILL